MYNNRRRAKTAKGKRLQRQRSERVERSFAHTCETGGARRTWLCGFDKVRKRYLITALARNLGLLMRALFGMGTARSLQKEGGDLSDGSGGLRVLIQRAWLAIVNASNALWARWVFRKRPNARNPQFTHRLALAA